ncbi:SWI/SNF complex subunit SWI3C-like [Salvia divinorum]|uniref:SWI/SNF complex subunit SWI3C-like n=1 Tax=Salvia divinorum TaxID=28513 RepID=A0ABD1IFV8_SALDI
MRPQRMELTYEEDSDIDSAIREKLSKHQCNYCSRPIPAECYQLQKEVDARLYLDCYHEVGLIAGHSSLDFIKENSTKDYGRG